MVKLHLGCGPHALKGWVNVDIEKHPGVVAHDIRKGINMGDKTVDFIFTEHFIEHLTRDEGVKFLKECFRVLKDGGALRISTPDLFTLIDDYSFQKIDRWEAVWKPKTPCQMLNEGMREWGHKFLYDSPELYAALLEAGFTNVRPEKYKSSYYEELRDLEIRPYHEDLILEAIK